MVRYGVRELTSSDFIPLMELEEDIFGNDGEKPPYHVRVSCDLFADSCFVCTVETNQGPRIVGYLLSFVRDREAWCTTLAVHPDDQGSRVVLRLLQTFVRKIAPLVDVCWFTAKADNHAARALHRTLGAQETGMRSGYYGPDDERIVSRIVSCIVSSIVSRMDRAALMRMALRCSRLGLIDADGARIAE